MIVGACRLTLRLPGKASLKEKRAVVRSVTARLRSKFNVSVAEVDDNDRWQIATLGVTCVSNDALHARQMLETVVAFVEHTRLDAELVDSQIEVEQAF
ncbi:MAG: DUF503 domain-containing protein [Dehalococcoidia bacterium]